MSFILARSEKSEVLFLELLGEVFFSLLLYSICNITPIISTVNHRVLISQNVHIFLKYSSI